MKNTLSGPILLGAMSAALAAAAALPAAANPPPTVQYRLNHEQARINKGVQNGSLTEREYNRDERHIQSIEAQRDQYGNRLNGQQQRALRNRLTNESNRVYFTKHNRADQRGS